MCFISYYSRFCLVLCFYSVLFTFFFFSFRQNQVIEVEVLQLKWSFKKQMLKDFVALVCVYSNSLRDAENFIHANSMVTPIHIKPEWYFLFAYAILRCIPDKTTRVLALAASVVLPICRILGKRQSGLSSIGFFVYVFIWLTVFRRMPIILHYYFGSQVLSVLYFLYLLFFL